MADFRRWFTVLAIAIIFMIPAAAQTSQNPTMNSVTVKISLTPNSPTITKQFTVPANLTVPASPPTSMTKMIEVARIMPAPGFGQAGIAAINVRVGEKLEWILIAQIIQLPNPAIPGPPLIPTKTTNQPRLLKAAYPIAGANGFDTSIALLKVP